MSKKGSIVIASFSGGETIKQASASSKEICTQQRINVHMVQNVLLIWLDSNIDESNDDCQNTITQLRRSVNHINTFTDGDKCIEFIESINNEKACMIISGSLGQHIVPRVHNMPQIDSIFIFCGNKNRHEQWAKEWPKIKGVYTEISLICEELKQTTHQCEHNALSISFMVTSGDTSKKSLNQLDCSFMYTQILKEILLTIKFEQEHFQEFIDYCRQQFANNEYELQNIKQFEQKYHDQTPIRWYTHECFLYPMLNRALRTMDVDIIVRMGFFINDLHCHIARLHSEQFDEHHCSDTFTVYRGQGLSKTDFDQMMKTKGGLIAFNNFLSTSKDYNVSLCFAHKMLSNPEMVGILFVMTVHPSQSTTVFASITNVSNFHVENEVLFSMHSVFRIHDIKPLNENNRLYQVCLTLTSDNDKDLRMLTERIREETEKSTGWYRLGAVLCKMGRYDKAHEIYQVLLDRSTNENEKGCIYHQLGMIKDDRGEYQDAILFYEKALEIDRKTLSSHNLSLATSYNDIGAVYRKMNEHSKALSYYEKALEIRQKSLSPNHPDLAMSYNNIGNVYYGMGDYSKALSFYEKAVEIKQQSLPSNHSGLGSSYNNIGLVNEKMGNYLKACSFYERAVDIGQHSLPSNHPHLQNLKQNLENVKKKL